MNIGKVGIWTSYRSFGIQRAGEAARLAEQLGYGTWWVGSSPTFRTSARRSQKPWPTRA